MIATANRAPLQAKAPGPTPTPQTEEGTYECYQCLTRFVEHHTIRLHGGMWQCDNAQNCGVRWKYQHDITPATRGGEETALRNDHRGYCRGCMARVQLRAYATGYGMQCSACGRVVAQA